MAGELGLDVVVSNPYMTLLIAKSKKKTDRVDAAVLADMLRGDFISQCYVPDRKTSDERKAVRHRHKLVGKRTDHKNAIHWILLQMSFKPGAAAPFSPVWLASVRRIGDYRIDDHLMQIRSLNESIIKADVIASMAKDNAWGRVLFGAGHILHDRRHREVQQSRRPLLVCRARAVGEELRRDGAPRAHNPQGRRAGS